MEIETLLARKDLFKVQESQNDLDIIYTNRNYEIELGEKKNQANNVIALRSSIRNIKTKEQAGVQLIFDINNKRAEAGSISMGEISDFIDFVFQKNNQFFNKLCD